MGFLIPIIIFALIYTKVEGLPSMAGCGQRYQNLLQEIVTVKRSCNVAGFRDCCQIKELPWASVSTGVYDVSHPCQVHDAFSTSNSVIQARCDMETEGGNWIVIQRRINGSVDFYRNWTDYVHGFGDLEGEFWYGLENIHCLTTRDDVELRIELGNGETPSIVWTYQLFQVGGATTNYRLTVGGGQGVGSSSDSLAFQNGRPFSTQDNDNDGGSRNCATIYGGAWWYAYCHRSNLNGKYVPHTPADGGAYTAGANRLCWYDGSTWVHFPRVEMKVRPKRCNEVPTSSCN